MAKGTSRLRDRVYRDQVLLQWMQQDDSWYWHAPEQINTGAIFRYQDHNLSLIQVCTARGTRVYVPFQRVELRDAQSASDPHPVPLRFSESCTWTTTNLTDAESAVAWPRESVKQSDSLDVELSPDDVLAKLKSGDLSHEEHRRLIIDAEVLDFGVHQVTEVSDVLSAFIDRYRCSNDPQDFTSVASAIRKFVGIMDRANLGSIDFLLESGNEGVVLLEIELEVAKMVVRKLTANPPERLDPEPELADRLMELLRSYGNSRLLAREKYGAVVLNGILALVLLGSKHMDELLIILRKLPVSWFKQTLARRTRRVMNDIAVRLSQERCGLVVQRLASLISASTA